MKTKKLSVLAEFVEACKVLQVSLNKKNKLLISLVRSVFIITNIFTQACQVISIVNS